MKKIGNKEKILLAFVDEKGPVSKKDLSFKIKMESGLLGQYLKQLMRLEYVQRIGYGQYALTEKGRERAERLRDIYGTPKVVSPAENLMQKKTKITYEDTKIILNLVDKYGKGQLIEMLK